MTDQHRRRVRVRRATHAGQLFDERFPVVVVDDHGTDVAALFRRVEAVPAFPESRLTVITVDGDVDHNAAAVLSVVLWRELCGHRPVCCDLSRVTFFGAAGVRAILGAQSFAASLERVFFLRGVHGFTERVLEIVDPERHIRR